MLRSSYYRSRLSGACRNELGIVPAVEARKNQKQILGRPEFRVEMFVFGRLIRKISCPVVVPEVPPPLSSFSTAVILMILVELYIRVQL